MYTPIKILICFLPKSLVSTLEMVSPMAPSVPADLPSPPDCKFSRTPAALPRLESTQICLGKREFGFGHLFTLFSFQLTADDAPAHHQRRRHCARGG